MERVTNIRGDPYETTEYITLEPRFTDVFKQPAIIQLVCTETNDKIRRTNRWGRLKKRHKERNHTTGLVECRHTLSWMFLVMIDDSRMDLHPPNSNNKMSINGHISMARWVLEMVRNKIEHLNECYRNGVVYVRHRQIVGDDGGKVVIVLDPEHEVENQRGGNRILRAEKHGWQKHQRQIEDTIAELLRLRQALADGYCDGDNQ